MLQWKDQIMTIHSMTGFGRAEKATEHFTCTCEVKTLNSKFLEVHPRTPRSYNSIDIEINKLVKKRLNRGKAEVFVDLKFNTMQDKLPSLSQEAVKHFTTLIDQLSKTIDKTNHSNLLTLADISPADFFQFEGVLVAAKSSNQDEVNAVILEVLKEALDKLIKFRQEEGASLKGTLLEYKTQLAGFAEQISQSVESVQKAAYANYKERLDKVIANINEDKITLPPEERILAEIATIVEKSDIEEELVRFRRHLESFDECLQQAGPAGRKLDFICQELNREANTMASKLTDFANKSLTIELKQTIEKIRQQVQNIE